MGLQESTIKITIPEEQLWKNLKISNDFMFAKVMRNQELCKGLMERLLDIQIDHIEYPEEQKAIDISKDSKSVRLDVYLKDEKGTVYNIEIQTTNSKNLPRRIRYYSGMIDLNAIEKGADYRKLPQSFVIFICTFDTFKKGLWRYTFENVCREDSGIVLEDGTYKIFFNTKGTKGNINEDAKNILRFIENNTAEDDFTEKLSHEVQKIKENKEWQVEYMTLLMREREKYNEGINRVLNQVSNRAELKAGLGGGGIKGAVQTYENIGFSFQETVERIAEKFNFLLQQSEEEVSKYWI